MSWFLVFVSENVPNSWEETLTSFFRSSGWARFKLETLGIVSCPNVGGSSQGKVLGHVVLLFRCLSVSLCATGSVCCRGWVSSPDEAVPLAVAELKKEKKEVDSSDDEESEPSSGGDDDDDEGEEDDDDDDDDDDGGDDDDDD